MVGLKFEAASSHHRDRIFLQCSNPASSGWFPGVLEHLARLSWLGRGVLMPLYLLQVKRCRNRMSLMMLDDTLINSYKFCILFECREIVQYGYD